MHDSDTANDLMLAQMLQLQFDEEYEKCLQAEENRMNGTSKGKMLCLLYIFIKNSKLHVLLGDLVAKC